MSDNDNSDIYDKDHVPDPVVAKAVEEGVAVTDRPRKHRWFSGFIITIAIIIGIVGTLGAVTGAYNTFKLNDQSHDLSVQQSAIQSQQALQKKQQSVLRLQQKVIEDQVSCISFLQKAEQDEANIRSHIAAEDRKVIDDLIFLVATPGVTAQEFKDALTRYKTERHKNDVERQNLRIPKLPKRCENLGRIDLSPRQSPRPSPPPAQPSPSSTPKPTPHPTHTVSVKPPTATPKR